ncbi:nitroreductase family protein [Butyrivibrio sp. INlla14]|uniref:nitroreductase family protein n=1 Tax=Butyrivibrio sp. INlla14 TaxID=1520808 RepID=UPI000876B6A8|nr:nitroreductase family protein [Butyrivibrio sp. INlla14]SCY15572.1 Nitroreductase family protein [Butyrivibrio sp. INlla14]
MSNNIWFVGTANNDDSTSIITDKVYDRAQVLDMDSRVDPFKGETVKKIAVDMDEVLDLFNAAKSTTKYKLNKSNVFTYPGGKKDSGIEDASIVATHLMLAAANEGIDSCWLNFFDPEALADDLGLPENEEILMLLDLGYAAEGAGPLDNHNSRKELSETVSYI